MSTLEMDAAHSETPSLSLHGESSAEGKMSTNSESEAFTHASVSASAAHTECRFPALNINVVHQRRRVNPESLAQRLGPELVRDLDALITPGNTDMPSFTVRKELQERYNIDRRHIYDYFHSRGLRVVKEDKHGNVVTNKLTEPVPTPLPNLRRIRQPNLKSLPSHPSHSLTREKWTVPKPRGITKAKPRRPKRNLSANPKLVPCIRETSETKDVDDAATEPPPSLPTATYVVVNPLLPLSPPQMIEDDENLTFNSIENPLDESFSVARAIGDVAYAYRHTLVFQRMQELNDYPIKSIFADDSPLSCNEASPCSSDAGLLLPHVKPLAMDERQAIYKALSESFGPAHGIQEYQGSYRKYMEGRTKLYFEGLLSVPCHPQPSSKASTSLDRKSALDTNEFRHWLSEIKFLERDGNSAPRLHHNHRSANVARSYGADTSIEKPSGQRSIPHWIQTLDDLFPTPAQTLKSGLDIMQSPVVRTQELPRTAPLFSSDLLGDESTEGDLSLSSGAFSPILPARPETYLPEAGQNCRTRFHGFRGPQEVTTRAPAADLANLHKSEPSQSSHFLAVLQPSNPGIQIAQGSPQNETPRRTHMGHVNNARTRFAPCNPCKPLTRDRDRIKTRSITSLDARRRTPSAAGGI